MNHTGAVTYIHFSLLPSSPNAASVRLVLFTGSEDKMVKGVDVEEGSVRWSFEGHQAPM